MLILPHSEGLIFCNSILSSRYLFSLDQFERALSEIEKFERSLKRVLLRDRGGEIAGVFVFLFLYACVSLSFW